MRDLKKEIVEIVARIDNAWILKVICEFIHGMIKETQYEQ